MSDALFSPPKMLIVVPNVRQRRKVQRQDEKRRNERRSLPSLRATREKKEDSTKDKFLVVIAVVCGSRLTG